MYCPKCGVEVSTDANFCRNCAHPLRVSADIGHEDGRMVKSRAPVVIGYILALLPLLLLPIVFTPMAVGVGVFNVINGRTKHGVAHMVIGVVTGIIGTLMGGPGFGL